MPRVKTEEEKAETHRWDKFRITYNQMRVRCNPKQKDNPRYRNYAGRGIKCLWTSYAQFKIDMAEAYWKHAEEHGERDTTIDRIDNNGHYCKENCRWATYLVQRHNQRNYGIPHPNGVARIGGISCR